LALSTAITEINMFTMQSVSALRWLRFGAEVPSR
jgi:hypothetical protein